MRNAEFFGRSSLQDSRRPNAELHNLIGLFIFLQLPILQLLFHDHGFSLSPETLCSEKRRHSQARRKQTLRLCSRSTKNKRRSQQGSPPRFEKLCPSGSTRALFLLRRSQSQILVS